jgi:hypothetical protein
MYVTGHMRWPLTSGIPGPPHHWLEGGFAILVVYSTNVVVCFGMGTPINSLGINLPFQLT